MEVPSDWLRYSQYYVLPRSPDDRDVPAVFVEPDGRRDDLSSYFGGILSGGLAGQVLIGKDCRSFGRRASTRARSTVSSSQALRKASTAVTTSCRNEAVAMMTRRGAF